MPRLFIYQTEVASKKGDGWEAVVSQLKLMSARLWYIITWPAGILTTAFAIWLLFINQEYLRMPWMHLKLGLVLLLFGYHGSLQWFFKKTQNDVYPWSGSKLRFYNEAATMLLFAIVFTVVFKDTLSWLYGIAGLILLGLSLSIGILLYKRARKNRS